MPAPPTVYKFRKDIPVKKDIKKQQETDSDKSQVSTAFIMRLPRYHRYLGELLRNDRLRISSSELSAMMGVTASQIRQDLNCFGGFGQQGYGYNVKYLHTKISDLLGVHAGYSAVIIGAGNLGRALVSSHMFERRGVKRLAMFDIDPSVVGKAFSGIPVYHIDELADFTQKQTVDIAVLTTPKEAASQAMDLVVSLGIRGIWNFSNMELCASAPGVVTRNMHLGDQLMTLCYELSQNDRKKESADAGDGQ